MNATPASAKPPENLNIVIVGHVDHGKSTLLGRLYADTGSLPDGKLEKVQAICRQQGKEFEYAFLFDAFLEEQEQGITIDTARTFFNWKGRQYIIIDAPGHKEFLKNMISGAARAEAALLPDRGPLDRYRRREAVATIDDQQGRPVDIDGLQQAVSDIPHRLDRTEALASLAVFLARRAVNGGDWRAPLADVRQQIPGSDVEILVRDFGWPQLQILARWIVVPFAGLLGLIALSLTVGAGTARP